MICGCGGSKSRLAKAAGVETSGQMRDEKVHAVVARSAFASEKAKNSSPLEHALLEVELSKKCTPLWREARFQAKTLKTPHAQTTFEGSAVVACGRCKGFSTLPKAKCDGFDTDSTKNTITLHYNYNYN